MPVSGSYTSESLERLGIHENPRLSARLMDFIMRNRIDADAFVRVRCLTLEYQERIIDKGDMADVANPSNVLIARIRDLLKHPVLGRILLENFWTFSFL